MCMYFDSNIIEEIKEDIYSYIVFKKRKFGKRRKTIRRGTVYKPTDGLVVKKYIRVYICCNGPKIIDGIFSNISWCPIDDPECEVWLCKIPAGSLVARNSWEYGSNTIQFIKRVIC